MVKIYFHLFPNETNMFETISQKNEAFFQTKTSNPTQKELISAIETNLNPLLRLLKFAPTGIEKLDKRNLSKIKIFTFTLRLISILLFLITCVIFLIATYNAQHSLSPNIQTERVVQVMILIFTSIALAHLINIICAAMWFYNNGLYKFCFVLSQVCFIYFKC
jgi:hypothetical protein